MSQFKQEPVFVLHTMQDVLNAINTPNWREKQKTNIFNIKSLWLVQLIKEIQTTQFPYNHTVKQIAEQKLGFPTQPEIHYHTEGDTLSALIYNAQKYIRSDQLKADGYTEFTQTFIDSLQQNTEIITESKTIYKIKLLDGKLRALKPNKRKNYTLPQGEPVKIHKLPLTNQKHTA